MKLIVANWKMNYGFSDIGSWLQNYLETVSKNVEPLNEKRVVVCPPFHLIEFIDSELTNASITFLKGELEKENKKSEDLPEDEVSEFIMSSRALSLGAQDCHHEDNGAYTGDISAKMLSEIGCEFVITGHSERRIYHKESDKKISKKISAAIKNSVQPILCIGEPREIREEGKHLEYITNQISNSLPSDQKIFNIIIAYEPIWSIGTGKTPNVNELSEMAQHIKSVISEKMKDKYENLYIIYGGSINSDNSNDLMNTPGIDGLLVGKASLDPEQFCKIIGLK